MNDVITYLIEQITAFDFRILQGLYHNWRSDALDTIMPQITRLGDAGILWIIVALVLLIPKKTRKTGASVAMALVLGLIIGNGIIKNLVMRPRPFDCLSSPILKSQLLIPAPTDYSFPSGHTLASFEAATAISKDHTLWGFAAYVVAILIAFSRLYLQVHYPSDVLAGMILGSLLGLLGSSIVKTISDKFTFKKYIEESEKKVADSAEE